MHNEIAKQIHADAVKRGFYDEPREIGTTLMLCVSELAEALEADRKDKHADLSAFYNSIKPNDIESFKESFKANIKDTFEDEISDTFIRLYDLVGWLGIDIDAHIKEKLEYNRTRGYKHGKNY